MPTTDCEDTDAGDLTSSTSSWTGFMSSGEVVSSSLLYRFSDISLDVSWHQSLPRKLGAFGKPTHGSSLWHTTRQQKLLLFALALVELSSNMCLSVMAPFFPDEAMKKGVSDTLSGTIFGVFPLVQFLVSPIFGKLVPLVGSRFLFLSGQFFGAGCVILFGFLDYVSTSVAGGNTTFIVFCFVVRGATALGCTASTTASFVISASTFPGDIATVFGVLETAAGIGLMTGPAVGGILFQYADFAAPFVVLGLFMLLTVPLCAWLLPLQPKIDDVTRHSDISLICLLSYPPIAIISTATVLGALIWSIIEPILEPHLIQFDLSPSVMGLVFLLMSAFYAIFSPIWGWLADRMTNITLLLVPGFVLSVVGLLMLGPSPLFEFGKPYNALWLNIVALIILGISVSLSVVPTYIKILTTAKSCGIQENASLYASMAGLWGSMYALGDFIGPSIGGFMYDTIGFGWTMTCAAAACALMAIVLLLLWIYERNMTQPDDKLEVSSANSALSETTPLLADHNSNDPLHGTFWKSPLL